MDQRAAEIRQAISECVCPFCGAGPFKSVATHCNRVHDIDRKALRVMAELTSRDSLASPERQEQARVIALERGMPGIGARESAERKGEKRGHAEWLLEFHRKRIGAANSARMLAMPAEERSELGRRLTQAVPETSRKRQGEWLRRKHADNPMSDAERKAFAARMQAPEVVARREAAKPALLGHGTLASYSRGCRCDECRAAKRASR